MPLQSRHYLAALLSLFIASACASHKTSSQQTYQRELERIGSNLHATSYENHGVALVLSQGNHAQMTAALGNADPAGTPMTAATPLRIASIAKTFVAAAILRLQEEGQLSLDAPLTGLISSALETQLLSGGYDTTRITVRHLLTDTGGLND